MNARHLFLPLALCAMALCTVITATAEPIHFHGNLATLGGNPVSGAHRVTFTIYAGQTTSGQPLWSETQSVVADNEGHYAVELASSDPAFSLASIHDLFVTTTVEGEATNSIAKSATVITTIPQGIWLNCNPDNGNGTTDANCSDGVTYENTETAIQTIAAGHFRYIINADNMWGTSAQITAYANQANTSGVKIIWYIGSDFSIYLSTSTKTYPLYSNDTELPSSFCSGCTNSQFTTALINLFKSFPATAGYMIDDEEIQGNTSGQSGYPLDSAAKKEATKLGNDLAALAKVIRAADPNHPIYGTEDYADINTASEAELATYFSYIANGTLNYYGSDYYPFGSLNSLPSNAQLTADQQTASDWLDTVASSKSATGTFEDLQAFNWADSWEGGCQTTGYACTFPTVAQLQDMLKGATTSTTAPAQLFWWEYPDVVYNNQWSNLLSAANPQ
jgi:hypothetical protein